MNDRTLPKTGCEAKLLKEKTKPKVLKRVQRLSLFLLLSSSVFAQESCESLVGSIELAFESANEVIMSTEIKQGALEYAYTKMKLYKDDADEWQSEQLEQRGIPRPPQGDESEEDGEEPSFEFDCTSHELIETPGGWQIVIDEQDDDIPIKEWELRFEEKAGVVVPVEIAGSIETSIFFIPFNGRFSTSFADWRFP